jgi:hypothetical protein
VFLCEVVGSGKGKVGEEKEEDAYTVSDMSEMNENEIIMMMTMTTMTVTPFITDHNTIC